MTILILGLALFLGAHSMRLAAAGRWRTAAIARVGENSWKIGYAVASLTGLVLVGKGWALTQVGWEPLWNPPTATRHVAGLLMLMAFILLVATYLPKNSIRARLHHPMLLSVKLWALAHLLANGGLPHLLLFGSFLLWAVLAFRAARQRDRAAGTAYPPGTAAGTIATVVLGLAAWAAFAFWAHLRWIGVAPFAFSA